MGLSVLVAFKPLYAIAEGTCYWMIAEGHHLLAGKVQIHVDRAVKVAVRVSADVNRPLGGVVFVGFLVRGLLYFKHMIAPFSLKASKSLIEK